MQKNLKLETVFANKFLFEKFKEHAKNKMDFDNFECYVEIMHFKNYDINEENITPIYSKYIKQKSKFEINISNDEKKNLDKMFNDKRFKSFVFYLKMISENNFSDTLQTFLLESSIKDYVKNIYELPKLKIEKSKRKSCFDDGDIIDKFKNSRLSNGDLKLSDKKKKKKRFFFF